MLDERPLLSATKIELFRDCERKWAFKYLERVQVEENPKSLAAKKLGIEVQDEQIDPYLLTGKSLDFSRASGEIAQKLLPLLPAPMSPGMQLRYKFLYPSPSNVFVYRGEFDLRADDSGIVPGLVAGWTGDYRSGVPLVWDTKTTGNFAFNKTPEKLKTDVQAIIYAIETMFRTRSKVVDLVWGYSKTVKPWRSERWHLRIGGANDGFYGDRASTSQIVDEFGKIDRLGQRLAAIRKARPKPDELPPNVLMCDEFGGCPYRHLCNLSPAVQAAGINEAFRMNNPQVSDFMAGLRVDMAPAAPAAPLPVPPVPPGYPAPGPGWPTQVPPAPAFPGYPPPGYAPPAGPPVAPPGFMQPGYSPPPAQPFPVSTPFGTATQEPAHMPTPAEAVTMGAAAVAGAQARANLPPPAPTAPIFRAPINPPESALPPAPPVGAAAPFPVPAPVPAPAADAGRFRRTQAEIAAGLSVEQAKAARAGQAPPLAPVPPVTTPAAHWAAHNGFPAPAPGVETGRIDSSKPNVAAAPRAELGSAPPPDASTFARHASELVATMRALGVKRMGLNEGKIYEIELFPAT